MRSGTKLGQFMRIFLPTFGLVIDTQDCIGLLLIL